MSTMDLIGKVMQALVGLAAFGVVMALLLAFLDRPEDKPRMASWGAAIKQGLRPRVILIAAFALIAILARVLYGAVPWMTQARFTSSRKRIASLIDRLDGIRRASAASSLTRSRP